MAVLPLDDDDPQEIGRYRLTGRLGEGGQGVVYLGETPDGQFVAVKVLKTRADAALARFAREMAAAKRVAPFCTAAVLDSSIEGRHPYVVSEYVAGPSLQQRVAERGPPRGGDLDRLMVNTASGLTAIHGAGIVHRDLKPANVLLGPDGPRVVDFGIARAVDAETHTQMVGTPAYFAPEWLRGEPPTPASDVFAWAGTMVFAATGRPPFGGGTNIPALMHRIATAEPDLSGVPAHVRSLLAGCLDKDPSRRPTARDLLMGLTDPSGAPTGTAGAVPQPTGPHSVTGAFSTAPGIEPGGKRTRLMALLAAAVVSAVVVGSAAWIVLGDRGGGADDGQTPTPTAAAAGTETQTATGTTPPAEENYTWNPRGQLVPASFAGTWRGEVEQPSVLGSKPKSDVTLTLSGGKSEGKADYGNWGCKNRLRLTSINGSTLEFDETVEEDDYGDSGACQGGTVRLTLANGTLRYESPSIIGEPTRGTLRRD
jgi:eukaryotic-like serine/threonine-protein kinase